MRRSRHRTPALAAALAVALVPSAGRGEDALGVLAVAEPPGPGPALVARAGELRAALAARTPGVLAPEALRERMTASAPPSALADLDRALAGALAAHVAGDYETSNRTLRSVLDALEALPDGPEVFAAWSRAMLRLARSEQELGRGVEAQAVLERLLLRAPGARADPRQFPPSFQRLVDEARARLSARGIRRLTVEAHPAARVFVDGREVGTSPITVDLVPGPHRVTGLRGGVRAPAVQVELSEDGTIHLDMSLADALRPDGGPGLALAGADRRARLLAAAARIRLDRVVFAEEQRDGEASLLAATLLDVRRGVAEREGRIRLVAGAASPGAVEALASYLLSGEPSPLVTAADALALGADGARKALGVGAPQRVPAGPRRGSAALGWSALGAGGVALAAGTLAAVYGRAAQRRYDEARAMLGPSGLVAPPNTTAGYNAALEAGDRRRDTAVALGVGAGVSAATSAVLAYVSWRRTGEIGPIRF